MRAPQAWVWSSGICVSTGAGDDIISLENAQKLRDELTAAIEEMIARNLLEDSHLPAPASFCAGCYQPLALGEICSCNR